MNSSSTGYRPSNRLIFDGDERNYELWKIKFLGCLRLKKLSETILTHSSRRERRNTNSRCNVRKMQMPSPNLSSVSMTDPCNARGYKQWKKSVSHFTRTLSFKMKTTCDFTLYTTDRFDNGRRSTRDRLLLASRNNGQFVESKSRNNL